MTPATPASPSPTPSPTHRIVAGFEASNRRYTVRDQIVQAAAKIVTDPIFEADFSESSYGYRPGRSATDALERIRTVFIEGYRWAAEFDISDFFGSIGPYLHLEVAVEYVEAAAAHDVDAATELLAPNVAPLEDMEKWGHDRAYGWVVQRTGARGMLGPGPPGCEETSTGPDGTTVECSIGIVAEVGEAFGLEREPASTRSSSTTGRIRPTEQSIEDEGGLGEAGLGCHPRLD
jgi:hypothetical protein